MKLPHERLWAPGTLLNQSGMQTVIELGDGKTVRRHTDHVRPRSANRVTVEDANESLENDEETNSDTTQALSGCDEPIAIRKPTFSPKPIDRFVPGRRSKLDWGEMLHTCVWLKCVRSASLRIDNLLVPETLSNDIYSDRSTSRTCLCRRTWTRS
ncbi:unnamed protein product [Echinostoma caproni]|uniref:Uncharacterized protein n=1 Tax=Echinostoma caproni TaxID=27848 RepID=A0A183A6I9_9TREM|nr:unnamed protein product [Echinostoma caproni]